MKTLTLDDELDAALDAASSDQGRNKTDLIADVLRKYVEKERLKRDLNASTLAALYNKELADEDMLLAEEGMAEYQRMLEEADRP